MRVTIIPSDSVVLVDGRAIQVDLTDFPANIHAVQWDGAAGHVEYAGGPNQTLDSIIDFMPWVSRWYAQRAIDDAPPPPPTAAQIQRELTDAVQRHLDATAKTHGYDGILSLASYAVSTYPSFAAEGRAGADWRDAVWGYCYQVLAAVQAGTRTIPTADALIAELPAMVWPG